MGDESAPMRQKAKDPAKGAASFQDVLFERRLKPAFTIAEPESPVAQQTVEREQLGGMENGIALTAPISEEAMFLAARVRNVCRESGQSIMFTGIGPDHGSTEIAAQIALAITSMNLANRLLVIDANPATPLHAYFGVSAQPGLMDSFADQESVFKHLRRLPAGLSVLPIGKTNDLAVNQLIARRGIDLFESLTHCHTLSIVNGPAFGSGPDLLLATRVTYTAIVATRGKVGPAELRRAKTSIESVGGRFAGVVLTRGR